MRVPSTDEVSVAVHELGGSGPPLLLSHATGFHGWCYGPIADALADRFRSFALDFRGHGSTSQPADGRVDWTRYGDDALAAARAVAPGGGLVGFGHSMGGAALLMAAHRDPELFRVIVAFEPIVFPTGEHPQADGPSPLVAGARKRRPAFASYEDAIANYGSKPPMATFDPEVLRLYVNFGFWPASDGVRLACDPEHEARTFELGHLHDTWDRLPEIDTQVVVIASGDGEAPAAIAPEIAARLPHATLVQLPGTTHFLPFTDPARTAALIADAAA